MNLNEVQDWVKEFNKQRGWSVPNYSAFVDMNYLATEVGEVGTEVIKIEIGREGKRDVMDETDKEKLLHDLTGEIGDVLFSLATIANRYDIKLDDAMKHYQEKMRERFENE